MIKYQYEGTTGTPDFLYCSERSKAILDTKYIPKYDNTPLDTYVIRQLSGYSRDIPILERLGYEIKEDSPTPPVPCIVVYPKETKMDGNPFLEKPLMGLCTNKVNNISQFYLISVPVPIKLNTTI